MKIIRSLFVLLVIASLCACNDTKNEKKELPVEETGEVEVHYRDIMVDYDEVEKNDRIVILQTALYFTGREGLYTEKEVEAPVDINYEGATVPAFKMSNVTKFLFRELSDTVSLHGSTDVDVPAEEFNSLFVLSMSGEEYIPDFKKGSKILLVDESGKLVCDDFKYAVTKQGEGIISVSSKDEIPTAEILTNIGWDVNKTVNLVASDKFYVPDAPIDGNRGSLVGLLSGLSVNGKILDTSIAQGKINDLLYIEKTAE